MDSTTAQPSFASFLSERRAQPHAQVLTLMASMADPAGRRQAARQLAAHAGGDDLLIFLRDPQVGLLLPAPGFPQTLPEPRLWRQLLDGCIRQGRFAAEVGAPGAERRMVMATAFAAEADTVLVLLGAPPRVDVVADVCLLLPLVRAALRGESTTTAAEAHAAVAREAAVQTNLLATSLESARSALQRALAEAEAANTSKDRFLAALSHELRTPLSPVVLAVAAMETHPDLPFELREELVMVRRNLDLETRLIDDLLDLSRIASGKLRLQMQPTSMHEVLRHALETCAADVRAKRLNVALDLQIANDQVTADPARLQQVLWNLMKNAVKFTPEGGDILVHSRDDGPGRLRVEIQDTGVGIPPDVLPKIFDAFEQGDAQVTRQFGGLGLGLAISKALVEMHRGKLRAHSLGAGRGASFIVELNTIQPQAPGPCHASPSPAPGPRPPRRRILLVDDHADTARTLARLLKSSGYEVKTAGGVAAALAIAAAEPFDLLVSDIGLPDATGYELMRRVRDLNGVPGIALTGYGMDEDLRKSREAGFSDHVVKPVNLAQLEAVIERVVSGRESK